MEFNANGRNWSRQDHFPWKEVGVATDKVMQLYNMGFLYHNAELSSKMKVGDGLESLGSTGLDALVDEINRKVKAKTSTEQEFTKKKCKKSKILDKQRGLIRSWRRNYGELEV
jgi:hypothetical protein